MPEPDIRGPLVYLDANIFIYAFEDFASLGEKVRRVLVAFDQQRLRVITSELSLAELLVRPMREKNDAVRRHYEKYVGGGGPVEAVAVTRSILIEAARIRSESGLKLPDAIHAATAMLNGCKTFLTNDPHFRAVPDLPVALISAIT